MRPPRWLSLAVLAGLLLQTWPATPGRAVGVERAVRPVGTGARFLPPETAFYLAIDADPNFDQFRNFDRLAGMYVRASEAGAAERRLAAGRAPGSIFEELLGGQFSWVGGEVFFAVPTLEDWQSLLSLEFPSVNVECREPELLIGAAIGSMPEFLTELTERKAVFDAEGLGSGSEQYRGIDLLWVAGRSPELKAYLAVQRDFILISTSRAGLVAALERDAANSLATSATFREARESFTERPFGFAYTNIPGGAVSFSGPSDSARHWAAGSLRVGEDSLQLDAANTVASETLSPAAEKLLTKPFNPLRSAAVAPGNSAFFVGWDNVKLLWDLFVESTYPQREDYDRARRSSIASTGLDPEDDIFGWMTGELTIFLTPSRELTGPLRGLAVGLAIEAKDASLVRQKVDKIADALQRFAASGRPSSTQEIAGVQFRRTPIAPEAAVYGALVDTWAVFTTDAGVAADTVHAVRGQSGLAGQTEFVTVRSLLSEPAHVLGYVNPPELLRISASAADTAGGSQEDIEAANAYLRPIRGVGLSIRTALDRIDSTSAAHIVLPDEPLAGPAPSQPTGAVLAPPVLIDISRHGGAWKWGDQPRDRLRRSTQASPLERFVATQLATGSRLILPGERIGRSPRDELGGSRRLPSDVVVPTSPLLVRVGSEGLYSEEELAVYVDYVRCGGTLLLLSDGKAPLVRKAPAERDELAQAFGLHATGVLRGEALLDSYAPHSASQGLPPLPMESGTALLEWDAYTQPIGFTSPATYLDLDGDERQSVGEPRGPAVYALRNFGRGSVAFLGTTSIIETPEHPLLGRLLRYVLPELFWRETRSSYPWDLATTALEGRSGTLQTAAGHWVWVAQSAGAWTRAIVDEQREAAAARLSEAGLDWSDELLHALTGRRLLGQQL